MSEVEQISEKIEDLEKRISRIETRDISSDDQFGFYKIPKLKKIKTPYDIDALFKVLVEHKASDLHIQPGSPPMIRIGGELISIGKEILSEEETAAILIPCLDDIARSKLEKKHEVDFAYETDKGRFRVNMFLSQGKLNAAFRHLSLRIPTLDELALPPVLKKACLIHNGLIIVTGPAGSGKSTTLASMIDHINENKRSHIVTLEEPIEFVHKNKNSFITQREVGSDTSSFYDGLKMSLRQDPNVILIGEMRDSETIMSAILAAETGHLVLSTLHTPNCIQAITRIIDAFPENQQKQFRLLLSNVLRCVVSQRLINKSGMSERVPAVEVLLQTPTVKSYILEGNVGEIYQLMQEGKVEGMQTFTRSLVSLYKSGIISKEDAIYQADQPTEFLHEIEGHQTRTVYENDTSTLIDWM